MELKEAFEKHIEQEALLRKGDALLAALSGGSDSVCLLSLLCALREKWNWRITAFHMNHGIRGEDADGDEAFCRRFCEERNIPFILAREDVPAFAAEEKVTLEEAGRLLRYRALKEAAEQEGAGVIVTAHHRDDKAETVLLNLLRGSGIRGLSSLRGRILLTDSLALVRPLLTFGKEELKAWLREQGIPWREDASNADSTHARNFLRNELLPAAEKRFPAAREHIAAAAADLEEIDGYLEEEARAALQKAGVSLPCEVLPLSLLSPLHPLLRQRLFRLFLAEGGLKDITRPQYQAMAALPEQESGTLLNLPGGRTLLREQGGVRLTTEREAAANQAPVWKMQVFPYEKGSKTPQKDYTKWMDYDKISQDVCLRHRREGDYFFLPDGKTKSLHRYFIDEKIPVGLRDGLWLFADGSHVLWIVGYRLSHAVYVTENTRTVLEITVSREEGTHEAACSQDHVQ
ncbi:MAG: tRNA lysidine(34) synthetase TilS [Lachnospiraceae bacterium]|nr:tRNA lysidine(34) synthetase TilS [Lachnospiraceae bacterium]